ncbi:MAG: GTPase RsgA [Firmicutes bacterium]|nr:GTPase RsgA [Bacillota bacterium]
MEKQRQCRGCGSILQSQDPQQVGYLPEHLLADAGADKDLICQRCYKLIHYGQVEKKSEAPDPNRVIAAGLQWAEGLLIVVDLMDFEASIPLGLRQFSKGKKTLVVVNKIDLLPSRTKVSEAQAWVAKQLAKYGIAGEIVMVSANSGQGIIELQETLFGLPQKKWLVIGATSVGKSTLISRILKRENLVGKGSPTVARFPGTTVERVQWELKYGVIVSDTPGFVPEGRLLDQLCIKCSQKLTPAKEINVKVYNLNAESGLVVPGLVAFRPITAIEEMVIGFTASDVSWQRTKVNKFSSWLAKGCKHCAIKDWKTIELDIPQNHDLVIHGLGWVSARRRNLKCEVTIPASVNYSIRENLIGVKNY